MRNLVLIFIAFVLAVPAMAQDKPSSPKAEETATLSGAKVKIVYFQPSARGRKIMGGLVPFGEVWRTGANDATTIEFDKAVKIEGKNLPAGKYALFTIPGENEWTIIFNKEHKQWGAYEYKDKEDALRVTVKPSKTASFVETFKITTADNKVTLAWENTSVSFNVK